MSEKAKIVTDIVVNTVKSLASDNDVQKALCGTYADGKTRSIPDAIKGEVYSSKQKAKAKKKKKKKDLKKFRLR